MLFTWSASCAAMGNSSATLSIMCLWFLFRANGSVGRGSVCPPQPHLLRRRRVCSCRAATAPVDTRYLPGNSARATCWVQIAGSTVPHTPQPPWLGARCLAVRRTFLQFSHAAPRCHRLDVTQSVCRGRELGCGTPRRGSLGVDSTSDRVLVDAVDGFAERPTSTPWAPQNPRLVNAPVNSNTAGSAASPSGSAIAGCDVALSPGVAPVFHGCDGQCDCREPCRERLRQRAAGALLQRIADPLTSNLNYATSREVAASATVRIATRVGVFQHRTDVLSTCIDSRRLGLDPDRTDLDSSRTRGTSHSSVQS